LRRALGLRIYLLLRVRKKKRGRAETRRHRITGPEFEEKGTFHKPSGCTKQESIGKSTTIHEGFIKGGESG